MWFKAKQAPSKHAYAVVTGAGSGIGRSFALELARRGGQVVCADLNLDTAQETVDLIAALGQKAYAVQCDVRDAEQLEQLAQQAEQHFGRTPTLLINNAGVGLGGKFDEMSMEDWQWCLNINLWGVIHGCQAFVPRFKAQKQGAIINVASAAAFTAAPEMAVYNVSKAGVFALSETLSAELAKYGIRVNVLCPTLVPTNIIKDGRLPERYHKLAQHALMNYALTTADDVAKLTLNRLDQGHLHTIPQLDAKFFWWLKRMSPTTYQRIVRFGYRWMK